MPSSDAVPAILRQPLPARPDTRRIIPSVGPLTDMGPVSYTRFIPREELGEVKVWSLPSFGAASTTDSTPGLRRASSTAVDEPTAEQWRARIEQARDEAARQARKEGYEEGYRDGLVALEGFKKSYAQETSARIGEWVRHFDAALAALEPKMAEALVGTAVHLARQVVRQELQTRPEHVADVARESVQAVLMSARQIAVRVHPDDLPLVKDGAAEAFEARGARLVGDPRIQRGGCLVESDAGAIDATIGTRWAQAAEGLGHPVAFDDGREAAT